MRLSGQLSNVLSSKRFSMLGAAIFALVAACTLLLTLLFLESKKAEVYERLEDRLTLQGIAQKERLGTWLRQTSSVADEFVNSETLRSFASVFATSKDVTQNVPFLFDQLGTMQNIINGVGTFNGLDTVALLDMEGGQVLTNNHAAVMTEAGKVVARQVAATGRVMYLPVHTENQRMVLDVFKPVFSTEKDSQPVAVLWMQAPLDSEFVKLLTTDGLPLRPTERISLWQLADGQPQLMKANTEGNIELTDLSRTPAGFERDATSLAPNADDVFAFTLKIPDAPWFITVEADRGPALQPLVQQRVTVFTIAGLSLIAVLMLAMVVYWWLLTTRYKAQVEYKDRLGQMSDNAINAMAKTIEARDPYLAGHSEKVSTLAAAVAKRMGNSEDDVATLRLAARLAGIGKLSVPMEILTKAGKLTDYERSQLQAHVLYAEKILREFHFDRPVADIVGQSAERADGSGYPRQLKGDKIHPLARILAVCDVYTALTQPRSYREKKPTAAAVREMQAELAKYDAEVFAALLVELDDHKA